MTYDPTNNIDKNKAAYRFDELIKGSEPFEMTKKKKIRTIPQNKYLHKIMSLFAIEVGSTLAEAKTDLKRECSFMRYEKNGKAYLKHTSELNTKELTDFIDFIRDFSGVQGIYLPTPEEYVQNQISINREIERAKQYT